MKFCNIYSCTTVIHVYFIKSFNILHYKYINILITIIYNHVY